jgi:methionyl-tRNA formyltransferase
MKILFLGYGKDETKLIDFLISRNHDVTNSSKKIENLSGYDLIISFGYRYIFKDSQLKYLKRPIINLHVSYLPFNRGSHPNFWAHYEGTPSGVSIHEIDAGIDTGPIIFQKKTVFDDPKISLQESYRHLKSELESLFIENINYIELKEYKRISKKDIGTYHKKSDLPTWVEWDMSIEYIKNVN